jgi:tetratricopeptide (TPR) repeat protein
MKPCLHYARTGCLVAMMMLAAGASVRSQDADLAVARDLYASAAYEDALALLNRLLASDHPAAQSRGIEQYRAFCLLALGRAGDAAQAIEAVVAAEPSYRPSDSDVSPRVRLAFSDVRRRMLPGIIQQRYGQAKAAYDRGEFASAADGFRQVLTALADSDIAAEATQPPLADLRMLAVGFGELSAKAVPPPPLAPPPAAAPAPAPVPAAAPPSRPSPLRVYSADDGDVVPPAALNQQMPAFPGTIRIPRTGRMEVVIDQNGAVESAVMSGSLSAEYDHLALAATKSWRYRPATIDGTPVKFKKVVLIALKSAR